MDKVTLILHNAKVVTLEEDQPCARLVACVGESIVFVGDDSDLLRLRGPQTKVVDCQGMTLVPGFHDAHMHFMALASSLAEVDCSPRAVRSIADIQLALQWRAAVTPVGQWVRGHGYDESALIEGRHPTRADLDDAVPKQPVRLDHRTKHACVLNTLALEQVGIGITTPGPVDGVVERDETGQPTGVLLEMNGRVAQYMPSQQDLSPEALLTTSRLLLSNGITSFQDASPNNSVERFDTFCALKRECILGPRVTVMPGFDHLDGLRVRGLHYGSGDDGVRVGHAKVMLTATTGILLPQRQELLAQVVKAQRWGFPVAIHAVEVEAVEVAARVLAEAHAHGEGRQMRHRIEHASECPPEALRKLRASGAIVVTQPGFIYDNGEKYRREVPREMQPYLYRVAAWVNAGVAVAFSSDAPVAAPNPWEGLYAAVTRRTDAGNTVAEAEAVDTMTALRLFTRGSAYSAGEEGVKGGICPGKLADLALVDADLMDLEPEELKDVRVRLTVVGGEVSWEE